MGLMLAARRKLPSEFIAILGSWREGKRIVNEKIRAHNVAKERTEARNDGEPVERRANHLF